MFEHCRWTPSPRLACTLFVLAAATTTPIPVAGQSGPVLGTGSRIRVTVEDHALEGREAVLDDVQDDAFLLRLDGEDRTVLVERDRIDRLEVWVGRRGNALRGLWIGGSAGIVGGALYGFASGGSWLFTPEEAAGMGAVFFGAVGAVGGLVAGAVIKTARWTEVEPSGVRLAVLPTFADARPGLRLRVTLGSR